MSDGVYATVEHLPERPSGAPGYPDRSPSLDALPGFKTPPPGYGEVPFYWWVGDKLTKERLLWQLDQLHEAGVQGFAVSYPHSHADIDLELNKAGYGRWGITEPGDPRIFSDEWWNLWSWFAGECAKRGMGVGLDDYTLCTPGNKQWPDDIAALPAMKNYQGKLVIHGERLVQSGQETRMELPGQAVSVMAYRKTGQGLDGDSAINLLPLAREGAIVWKAPEGEWRIVTVSTTAGFMLHPDHGKEIIERYFQKVENHVAADARRGLNYFFQDELSVPLENGTWSEDFSDEFLRRKGYDLRPFLAALQFDIGRKTPKIRLDYADVMVQLAEERYFRPILEWHWKRGLIYGCDNEGRGLQPDMYGDYFRAVRWFTAPGNDAPEGATALVQTKVSSSISHLYERPRVWLEAFHSMGWDAQPSRFSEAADKHFLLGGNLFCLHGLYYTTHGGWWEWAPPDFHFRMPYWPHMKIWLKRVERLSYLLSQGRHACDVAILYPVEPLQARNGGKTDPAFAAAQRLFDAGMDFDFVDFQSLARAEVKEGRLRVAGESYAALVLADMTAAHFSTLQKAQELHRGGGVVVGLGRLPEASDRIGRDDPEIEKILREVFGIGASEAKDGKPSPARKSAAGGTGVFLGGDIAAAPAAISRSLTRDFIPAGGRGHVLHRRAGQRDVFMVMDVAKGKECFFRCKGKIELWDAWTGEAHPLRAVRQTNEGTYVRVPLAPPQSSLIVFSPGECELEKDSREPAPGPAKSLDLSGVWECELVPTMDNRWGDFRLPASDKAIGAEARQFRYSAEEGAGEGWREKTFDDSRWRMVTCSFGPRLWKLNLPADCDAQAAEKKILESGANAEDVEISGKTWKWQPYEYSLRWGVENQPGSQGYHGLKEKVSDDFLIMGEGGHYFFRTSVRVDKETRIKILTSGRKPDSIRLDGARVPGDSVVLSAGVHDLLLCYVGIAKRDFEQSSHPLDPRVRGAVVLVEDNAGKAEPYPLAMRWYKQPGLVAYDAMPGGKTAGIYRFQAPPGLREMRFAAHGEVRIWVDGKEAKAKTGAAKQDALGDGLRDYIVTLPDTHPGMSTVALRIEHQPGWYAGAAIPDPIELTCGKGKIATGDWSRMGVLKHYSGGMWYRRGVNLAPEDVQGGVTLELGGVVATCEVRVNGKQAGVLVTDPFSVDISRYVKRGDNLLEILVYNTLSNHYQTIPTPANYKRTTTSGLIGPVKVLIQPAGRMKGE